MKRALNKYYIVRKKYVNYKVKRYLAMTEEELVRKYEQMFDSITIGFIFYMTLIFLIFGTIIGSTIVEVVRILVG